LHAALRLLVCHSCGQCILHFFLPQFQCSAQAKVHHESKFLLMDALPPGLGARFYARNVEKPDNGLSQTPMGFRWEPLPDPLPKAISVATIELTEGDSLPFGTLRLGTFTWWEAKLPHGSRAVQERSSVLGRTLGLLTTFKRVNSPSLPRPFRPPPFWQNPRQSHRPWIRCGLKNLNRIERRRIKPVRGFV